MTEERNIYMVKVTDINKNVFKNTVSMVWIPFCKESKCFIFRQFVVQYKNIFSGFYSGP